jgi:PAS domain S-box-containing protein
MAIGRIDRVFNFRKLVIYLVILFAGGWYVVFIWNDANSQYVDKVLQVARSVEASLPKDELPALEENPENLKSGDYQRLKNALQKVIKVNDQARFAYVYVERGGKLYFIADSEPETSPDYSPPGQEFMEADSVDAQPFRDGKALVTKPVTDRWGTWVSAEVPVKDEETGRVIAVFGMDYNAETWRNRILFEVFESGLMVIIILVLAFVSGRSVRKNQLLKKEISQRKKAEKELKGSESYFRLLFELNPQPMFVYDLETMKILQVNQSAIETYGYGYDEFLSMTIIDLKAPEEFTRLWKKLIDDPNSFQQTEIWDHRLKDGKIIQVEVHSHNLDFRHKDARLVLLIDVTEKIKTENRLRENELTLTNLIGNLPGMVYRCAFDENYNMIFMSEACARITGYQPSDFVEDKSITFNDLIFPEYRQPIWEKWLQVIGDKSVFEYQYPILTASGEVKWIWERGTGIYDKKGNVQFLEGYLEDMTIKRLNEEELIRAKEKAEESDRLKSAFLANISHEIRTPMNGILGFAELLKEPDLSPENQQEFLNVIEKSGQRMLNIINDLIDISKIEAGETTVRISDVNLNTLLAELHSFFTPEAKKKGIEINYHCPLPDELSRIRTDRTKLGQVLTNLIKNAIKFTESGSIDFGYFAIDSVFEFYITDTGQGIHPDQIEMVFERFRQGTLGLTRNHEGAGLGLAICKAYVELLGGEIWVKSELGKGSTFHFKAPASNPNG